MRLCISLVCVSVSALYECRVCIIPCIPSNPAEVASNFLRLYVYPTVGVCMHLCRRAHINPRMRVRINPSYACSYASVKACLYQPSYAWFVTICVGGCQRMWENPCSEVVSLWIAPGILRK